MNLSALKTFLAIVEEGSLVRASSVLNVTQSTVTARLKALETELGQPLVHRHKSGATLTPAGERLRRYAHTISDLWLQARKETALPDGFSSICNIACETELWSGLGERFFAQLRQEQPEVAISVWVGSQDEVSNWLAQGLSDLAFTYRSAVSARQDQIELEPDQLVLVSPDGSWDADPVFVEAGEAFGRDHAATYAGDDAARLSFNAVNLGLDHVLTNGGRVFLPLRVVSPLVTEGRLAVVAGAPSFERKVYLTVNVAARAVWKWFDPTVAQVFARATG